jgi:hypothetical protein
VSRWPTCRAPFCSYFLLCLTNLFYYFSFITFPFVGKWHSHSCFLCSPHVLPFCFLVGFNGFSYLALQVHNLVPFQLAPYFSPPLGFCYLPDNIKVLGVPFGFVSFSYSFLCDVLDENVCHANVLLKLKDVQIAFGILCRCFTQSPFHLFCALPPLSSFRH